MTEIEKVSELAEDLATKVGLDHGSTGDDDEIPGIRFVDYVDESQLGYVMSLVGKDLSEPYSSKCMLVESIQNNEIFLSICSHSGRFLSSIVVVVNNSLYVSIFLATVP